MLQWQICFLEYAENNTDGSVQSGRRPCIIVSNNQNNNYSNIRTIVPLSTRMKKDDLPTHIMIKSCFRDSMALCEQITCVSIDVLSATNRFVTDEEKNMVRNGILVQLGIRGDE